VTWPPKEHRRRGGPSPIPDLNSKINLGTNRKQKMNLELEAFHSAATLQLSSNPFASGCVKPGKFKADEIWKPGTEKSHVDVAETEKPKMILKENNNLQHNTKTGKSCYYNISPGKVKSVFIQ